MPYQRNPDFVFSVLVDDELIKDYQPSGFVPEGNESFVSVVNDFEDDKWRIGKFLNFVIDNLKETALTAVERAALVNREGEILSRAANCLRIEECKDSNSRGSEIGEILLYGLMREYYGALPAVPKIWHKQNRQNTAKGADSVHVVVKEDNQLERWLGEAKFYKNISGAIAKAVESVKDMLSLAAIRKETAFVTDLEDLRICLRKKYRDDAETLWQGILKMLDGNTSIDLLKPNLHIPILLLHECDLTRSATRFSEEYKQSIKNAHLKDAQDYFKKQVEELKDEISLYSAIHFHLVLFPVPSKESVVNGFYKRIEPFRE